MESLALPSLLERLGPQSQTQDGLRRAFYRRAAQAYEQAERWHHAATCWVAAGERQRAVALYLRQDNHAAVAPLLLAEKRYAEALEHYRAWQQALGPANIADQITAQLGCAACLHGLQAEPATVYAAWQTAHHLLHADLSRHPLTQGRCWEAVGAYGATVGRTDLMQAGYEQALRCYGTLHPGERLRAAQAYRQAVRGNALLAGDVATRVAELKIEAAHENGWME